MNHETEHYWTSLALKTRRFGHCYVHAPARKLGGHVSPQIRYTYTGWGRSLQSGGHKFKVHANWLSDGKPVPTQHLEEILRP